MMMHHLGSLLCAAAAIVSTAAAQTVVAHDCYPKLVPDIASDEIPLVAPLANVIATDGPSSTRQSGSQASTLRCDSPNDVTHINILSNMSVAGVSPTTPAVSNPTSNGHAVSPGAANSMAVCRPATAQQACNATMEEPKAKAQNVQPLVPKPAHKLTRYDSAAFAGAGALIGAALLF
ncbi:hypothetical protein MGG_02106 [Pyricularia oryzae 70-15]|uniref:Uncharacterized protein n=3 Tax=Pyricularia oryzae TaxID=318829 RepID=G4MNP8_PYRO7|nr:uncharacterized protein MGG_02106 [Pyricularia oryzae 70-15]EHA56264.1 hypothetical protein MGG_02106 [Pyricularia oryzae 70-15]ELQ37741.1 hypothetical protein OOU_Y34scaffold00580g16 [Pyricularia oryzae Y34]KAI7916294.1 hypothetical protein M9X92_007945 [Pyricularia oryzae]KAI7922475.1 hypothetical protein M0657_005602 [Pyricularia oryzae]